MTLRSLIRLYLFTHSPPSILLNYLRFDCGVEGYDTTASGTAVPPYSQLSLGCDATGSGSAMPSHLLIPPVSADFSLFTVKWRV